MIVRNLDQEKFEKGNRVAQHSASNEHKIQVQKAFGDTAQDYVESPMHRTGQDLVRIVELSEATPQDEALDIATGGGHTALHLAPEVKHIVVSDLTPRMLAAAQNFFAENGIENASFELADAEDLPFADASFDIVTCRIAPHHFSDPQAFVSEVARILRPGGRFVLMDSVSPDDRELDEFINEMEQRRDPTHVRSYNWAEWQRFFSNAGLVIDSHEIVIRSHEYESWTARMRMSKEDREALDLFILSQPQETLDHFQIIVQDQQIVSFIDHKVLLRARKQ